MPMDDVDMSGVSPERRAEVRRRIGVVREYLAIDNPTRDDDTNYAALMGLHPAGFLRLVRIWRETGKASALPGAQIPRTKRGGGSEKRIRTTAEVRSVVAQVMQEFGDQAKPVVIHREVTARCEQLGLPAPTLTTIVASTMRSRRSPKPSDVVNNDDPHVIVDHSALYLPVIADADNIQIPVLTTVCDSRGYIYSHELSLTAPSPQVTARALLKSLHDTEDPVPLLMNRDFTQGWNKLVGFLVFAGIDLRGRSAAPVPSGRTLRSLYGDAIGDIKLRPSYTSRPTEGRVPPVRMPSRPLTLDDARDAVDAVISAENQRRGLPGTPLSFVRREMKPRLQELLQAIAADHPEPARRRSR
jgi:hypothetical protein